MADKSTDKVAAPEVAEKTPVVEEAAAPEAKKSPEKEAKAKASPEKAAEVVADEEEEEEDEEEVTEEKEETPKENGTSENGTNGHTEEDKEVASEDAGEKRPAEEVKDSPVKKVKLDDSKSEAASTDKPQEASA